MTSLVTVQREVEKIKQKLHPEEPKDIWIVIGSYEFNPDDTVEVFRCTTRHHPNSVKFRCRYKDAHRKIAEVQNREQRQ